MRQRILEKNEVSIGVFRTAVMSFAGLCLGVQGCRIL